MSAPKSPFLNSERLAERINAIVEQAPYHPGGGGLASTDRNSYAEARALLVLVSLQAYPVLVRRFPTMCIKSLFEAHPKDGTTGVADEAAVKVFFLESSSASSASSSSSSSTLALEDGSMGGGGGNDSTPASIMARSAGERLGSQAPAPPPGPTFAINLRVDIPVRSSLTGKLLEIGAIRRYMWRALLLGEAGKRGMSEGDIGGGVAGLEEEYRAKYFDHAPKDVVHLLWMKIIRDSIVGDFERHFEEKERARQEAAKILGESSGGGSGGGNPGLVRSETRGSAVGLWWPVPSGAITFVEMQKERVELKSAMAAVKVAEADEARQVRLAAALKRQSSSPGT
jgi:hypothetical protein